MNEKLTDVQLTYTYVHTTVRAVLDFLLKVSSIWFKNIFFEKLWQDFYLSLFNIIAYVMCELACVKS